MRARFQFLLPFDIHVRSDLYAVHHISEVSIGDLHIQPYLPYRCRVSMQDLAPDGGTPVSGLAERLDRLAPQPLSPEITIDGIPAVGANALQVDFVKESFDRTTGSDDPPKTLAFAVVNSWISRLRTLGRAGHIRPLDPQSTIWRLTFLNDDETQLERQASLIRTRSGVSWTWKIVGLNEELATAIETLPWTYEQPPSDRLLLDAHSALPEVGPAVVLGYAAVETRIAAALDRLAGLYGVGSAMWEWINSRGNYTKEPSTAEQLDALLIAVCKRSLKVEKPELWQGFRNLGSARHSFVHEGEAKVGNTTVDGLAANKLLVAAGEIIDWIENLLPPDERRPAFPMDKANLEITRILVAPEGSTDLTPSSIGTVQTPEDPTISEL